MNVLVTGFSGSIGSEFTRQLLARGDRVTGIDNNEWGVVACPEHPDLTKRLGDFAYVSGEFDLIVHCAAYKHIDLIESNQHEALMNNYAKTVQLMQNAKGRMLFISTDKAVEPSGFYGTTKKLAEEFVAISGGVTARLGNVMGSSGSVIPRWEQAITDGLPLEVTDLAMTRYMISVEDAVSRILDLLQYAEPGVTMVPEMGDPVSLSDIVSHVLSKHGLPEDYPTVTVGLRPAEKMHEKLTWDDEKEVFSNLSGKIFRRWTRKN